MAISRIFPRVAPGHLPTGATRSFASSAAWSKSRPTNATTSPKTQLRVDLAPPSLSKDLRLPSGIKEWEVLSYSSFIKKLQKLNAEVQLTKPLADEALEKSVRALMPKVVWQVVQDTLKGGQKVRSNGGSNARQLVQNWKRLQAESTAFWAEDD